MGQLRRRIGGAQEIALAAEGRVSLLALGQGAAGDETRLCEEGAAEYIHTPPQACRTLSWKLWG